MTRAGTVLAAAGLLLALAGCGGADDAPSGGGDDDPVAGEVVRVAEGTVVADALTVSADGSLLAAPCDGGICVWDTASGEVVRTVDGGSTSVFAPVGTTLATGETAGGGTEVVLVDAATGEETARLPGPSAPEAADTDAGIGAIAVAPDGARVASSGHDGTVVVASVADAAVAATLDVGGDLPADLAFSADGSRLFVARPDAPLGVWDVGMGEQVDTLDVEPQGALAVSADGAYLATATNAPGPDARLRVWDAETLEPVDELPQQLEAGRLAFSPDSSRLAFTVKNDPTVVVWDDTDGSPLVRLTGHEDDARGLAWAPDGDTLYSASWTEGVLAWPTGASAPAPRAFDRP